MKKTIIIIVAVLMLSCVAFTQELNYTNPSAPIYDPPIVKDSLQDYVASVSVQIIVRVNSIYRGYRWLKYEAGDRLSEAEFARLDDDEKEWYLQGYKLGGKSSPKTEPWLICGSGVIVYSDVLKEGIQLSEECHGATYILTNWHVVDLLTKTGNRGSYRDPHYVYAEEDMIRSTYPPSIKIRKGARPIGERYFTIAEEYVTVKHSVDQTYRVRAEIIATDQNLDVAVLRLKNVWGLPYTTFRGSPCRVGEEIWMCGAPLALPFSLDTGRINQVGLELGEGHGIIWNNQVKMDIPGAPGSSGSGVLDANGKLICLMHGVLVCKWGIVVGGQLGISGMDIREWLIWNSFSFIVDAEAYSPIKAKK